MNYLSFDIGTTCCKCQLFSETGEILKYCSEEYSFLHKDEENYADIRDIWMRVKRMLREVSAEFEISSICISSFGESFVLLDEKDEILFDPMLYTDYRGKKRSGYACRGIRSRKDIFHYGNCSSEYVFCQ